MISILYTSCTKDEVIKQTNTIETNDQLANTLSSRMPPSIDWCDLTPQQQADFARFMGRLWGDGRPSDLDNLTGSRFTSKSAKHNQIYDRLKDIFDLPNNNTRQNMPNFWNYWIDALPGNNPGDPQILGEAVKDPNFIAGLIDAEGGINHNGQSRYLIDDQTFAPNDPTKGWDLQNFKPGRMSQLFCLLEETYEFSNTKIKIGPNEFNYAQKDQAIDELNARYNNGTNFTVKIFIDPAHFEELRSYGYWEKQNCANAECRFRSPAPDNASLNILTSDYPDVLTEYFQILHKENLGVIGSDIELTPTTQDGSLTWSILDVDGEYFRIVSKDNCKWLKAHNNMNLDLVSDQNTGWQTQWKKQQLADGYFYLINKKFKDKYLRADIGKTKVKLGAKGKQAQWSFSSIN